MMEKVKIVASPPGSKTIGWICEVLPTDHVGNFVGTLGHDILKLRTNDENLHPDGYFYVYVRNTVKL